MRGYIQISRAGNQIKRTQEKTLQQCLSETTVFLLKSSHYKNNNTKDIPSRKFTSWINQQLSEAQNMPVLKSNQKPAGQ